MSAVSATGEASERACAGLRRVFEGRYVGELQPQIAGIHRAGEAHLSARWALYRETAGSVEEQLPALAEYAQALLNPAAPEGLWRRYEAALERHTAAWQRVSGRCGFAPGARAGAVRRRRARGRASRWTEERHRRGGRTTGGWSSSRRSVNAGQDPTNPADVDRRHHLPGPQACLAEGGIRGHDAAPMDRELAEALNRGCDCMSTDAAGAGSRSLGDRMTEGWAAALAESHPNLFAPAARVRGARGARRRCARRSRRSSGWPGAARVCQARALGRPGRRRSQHDTGARGVLFGFDFHLAARVTAHRDQHQRGRARCCNWRSAQGAAAVLRGGEAGL
jgi:hypothetical protein